MPRDHQKRALKRQKQSPRPERALHPQAHNWEEWQCAQCGFVVANRAVGSAANKDAILRHLAFSHGVSFAALHQAKQTSFTHINGHRYHRYAKSYALDGKPVAHHIYQRGKSRDTMLFGF